MGMTDRDEELALFLEMRRREKEKESNNLCLLDKSDDSGASLEAKNGNSLMSNVMSSVPLRKSGVEEFLNSENGKTDYDWLLTPPRTPLFPSLDSESNKNLMNQITSTARPTALKYRLENIQAEPARKTSNAATKRATQTLPSALNSSSNTNKRPLLSVRPASAPRSATPTGHPTIPMTSKTLRPSTPISRTTLPPTKSTAPPVRSSTPTRANARSSTPTSRPSASLTTSKLTSRSATPTSRTAAPTLMMSKSTSRPATPTRRPITPSSGSAVSASQNQSSTVTKSDLAALKNPLPSRGSSPTVKSRPWKPSEMPGFSLETPPNLRTSLPARSVSASRGRPSGPSILTTSADSSSNGRVRQQSYSPSRQRTSSVNNRSSISGKSRAKFRDNEDVNPLIIGTKMVERVVNMRKLAPPKHNDHISPQYNTSGKSSSSADSSGFGRTLSKKSLDMALRHMDIRRSYSGGSLRPLMKNIPASSMYSMRSGSTRSGTTSVPDSPLATSSNASSEPSVNNNSTYFTGIEVTDIDLESEKGNASPTS